MFTEGGSFARTVDCENLAIKAGFASKPDVVAFASGSALPSAEADCWRLSGGCSEACRARGRSMVINRIVESSTTATEYSRGIHETEE
jgi:hypothetical protein